MENKSVLVTGGAGFIGSNIVEYLLTNGVKKVRVLDNLSTGHKKNLERFLEKYENLEFMYGNLANLEDCRKACEGMDMITNQAALGSVPRSINDPLSSHISNVNGFLNLLIAAKEAGIKRVVYASSSSVYGDHPDLPKQEHKTGKVLSPYAATKAIDEIYAQVFSRCYGMECIGLRYFNIFGKRQDPNGAYAAVIPKFIDLMNKGISPTINGDGTYSRDFTYIDNAVQANILGLSTENKEAFGEAFNIGAGGQTSILDLFNVIKGHLGCDLEVTLGNLRPGDVPHSNADISKAKNILGYDPRISFEEGIKYTIEYYSSLKKNDKINLEDIDFNKLLNREPINIDNKNSYEYLKGKKILITGGCGSIGSEIVRQLLNLNLLNLVIVDNSENGHYCLSKEINDKYNIQPKIIIGDVSNLNSMELIFKEELPQIVFHAAAYKHVPIMEDNPKESVKVNIIGSKNIADLSLKYNVEKFIMVSTDKAVNPCNVMGHCKRIAEIYTNQLNSHNKTKFITTRFGNVLGSSGSVLPTFIDRLNKNMNLQVTDKRIIRYFMTIPEAAQLVIKSSFIGNYNDILLFDMGEPVNIYNFSKILLKMFNRDEEIEIIGLRPGEKLYEELLCNGENSVPTNEKKIMKLKHNENINYNHFFEYFNYLIDNYVLLKNIKLLEILSNNKF